MTAEFHPSVNLNLNVRGLGVSATLAINELSNELLAQGRPVFKLGLGQSPFPVPPSVVEALREFAGEKDYLPVKGLPEHGERYLGIGRNLFTLAAVVMGKKGKAAAFDPFQ